MTPPSLFAIAWPMLAESVLGLAVGSVALALAGRAGPAAAAGFALATYVIGALQIVLRLIAIGVSVTVSQRLGAGRRDAAEATARAALAASVWLGAAAAIVTWLAAGPLLRALDAPAEVWPIARGALRLLAGALVLDACHASLAAVMRAHLRGRASLIAIAVMQALHLALAVPLMLGAWGLPALGVAGFAIAAVIARAVGVALHLALWRRQLGLAPAARDWWRLDARQLAPIARIGLPGAGENLAHWLAFLASVAAAGDLGARELALHGYVVQLASAVSLYGMTRGFATEIAVGHLIGARQGAAARRLVAVAMRRGTAVAAALAVAAAIAAPIGWFTDDAGLIARAPLLLWLSALQEPARNLNFVYGNALRAAGDARFPMVAGAGSMVIVLAGGAWLLGPGLGLGLAGIWIAYAADEWLRGVIMFARWRGRAAAIALEVA